MIPIAYKVRDKYRVEEVDAEKHLWSLYISPKMVLDHISNKFIKVTKSSSKITDFNTRTTFTLIDLHKILQAIDEVNQ